jgi:hypothetical protein
MKKYTHITLLIFVILTACGTKPSNSKTKQITETKVDLPKSFYKKLKGTINNNISITMDLIRKDSTLTGSYYYNNIGIPITIEGQISEFLEINLSELNEKYEKTGVFHGKFTSAETFEGTWTNLKTNKSLAFKLLETKEGIANISFENMHNENCPPKVADSLNSEKTCSYIDLNIIKVFLNNHAVSDLINKSINKRIYGTEYNSINAYLNSINEGDNEYYREIDINFFLMTNENNILCISEWTSEYNEGAAHPMSDGSFVNYDLKNGAEIKLDQILKPNSSEKLNRIAEKIFIDNYGSEGWEFQPGEFKLNTNFAITKGGLVFMFNPYEIGPYVAGTPEVFIPYGKINELIIQNGILARMTRK